MSQFEEDLMQETELAHGECSHPPLHADVNDESFSDFYDFDIYYDHDDIHLYHDSPIRPLKQLGILQVIH